MAKNAKINQQDRSNFSSDNGKPIFNWHSPEHAVYEKNASWYAALIITTLLISVVLYFQQLYSGMALVVISAISFIVFARTKPKEIQCAIFTEGIVVDGKVYRYGDFKSFWVTYVDVPKVRLQLMGVVAGQVTMPLLNTDVGQVRAYLVKHLPEDESKSEDLIDVVNRFLRF